MMHLGLLYIVVTVCLLNLDCQAVSFRKLSLKKILAPKTKNTKEESLQQKLRLSDCEVKLVTDIRVQISFLQDVYAILQDYQKTVPTLLDAIMVASRSKSENQKKLVFSYFVTLHLNENDKESLSRLCLTVQACLKKNKNNTLEVIADLRDATKSY